MNSAPRLILICCEGKTEQAYFEIIRDIYRGPQFCHVEILDLRGQHKALIDKAIILRRKKQQDYDLEDFELETWAVCDDDGMAMNINDLLLYAKEHKVELAFSRPQFEAFLVQHFEQSKASDPLELYRKLTEFGRQYGLSGRYENSKGDLAWLYRALFNKPKILDIAIVNSSLRTNKTDKLYLTVQDLVRRLKDLSI